MDGDKESKGINNEFTFKLYLNAKHAVLFGDKISGIHSHTFEVVVDLIEKDDILNQFNNIEKLISDYLDKYKDRIINDIYPFTRINPTSENMCKVFYEDINMLIEESEYKDLYKLSSTSVLENPTRVYRVKKIANYKDNLETDLFQKKVVTALSAMRNQEKQETEESALIDIVGLLRDEIRDLKNDKLKEKKRRQRNSVLMTIFIFSVISIFLLNGWGVIDIVSYVEMVKTGGIFW